MSKAVLRIMTAGLLTAVGVICSLGAGITAPAIAHGLVAVSPASGPVHSGAAAVPDDDQWG